MIESRGRSETGRDGERRPHYLRGLALVTLLVIAAGWCAGWGPLASFLGID